VLRRVLLGVRSANLPGAPKALAAKRRNLRLRRKEACRATGATRWGLQAPTARPASGRSPRQARYGEARTAEQTAEGGA